MKQVQELLTRQMTRKEFLRLFGVAVLASFGVNNFISYLLKNSKQPSRDAMSGQGMERGGSGFGSRRFGQ